MSRPSLADLQAFATVARLCNFRQAARELGVSPSALSHTLRNLESRLGLRLLNRNTRSVSPTEAGQRLLQKLSPALGNIYEALDEVNDFRTSPMGTLRFNVPRFAAEILMGPLVNQFLLRHPGMAVELVSDDAFVDIVKTGYDAGVRFGESIQQDMVAVPLGPPQRFVVAATPALIARHGAPRHPAELKDRPCIKVRFPSGAYYRWEFQRGDEKLDVAVAGPAALDEMNLIINAARAGLGFAYVYAQHVADDLATGRLQTVLEDWCPTVPGFHLYYPSRKLMSAGLKAFLEMVRETSALNMGLTSSQSPTDLPNKNN